MSLQRNILASLSSQVYVAAIGIVMVPMYLNYMGAEAYGLVSFFAMLQAWFNLLDVGLTPTISRESARQRAGAVDGLAYRRLMRTLELIFLGIGVAGAAALLAAAGYIASDWLRVSQLPGEEVVAAVRLMALIIAMRWMSGLYRAAIGGRERLVWLGGFNAAIATLRFTGVLPLLVFVGSTPTLFFGYQLVVALFELIALVAYAYRLLPPLPANRPLAWGWDWAALRPTLRFSLSIAFTSSVWVFVTQTDKLVLSRILPLAEYGYFTLAVIVAGVTLIVSGPIGSAIMPRLARLEAEGRQAEMIQAYRHSTQLVALLAGAASITVALSAESLLWVWTGNADLARQAAPVLVLYALGNGILAVSAFPYYLQFAKGDMQLHLIGNAAFVMLLVPLLIWGATEMGGVGAGYVWLGMNVLSFFAWLPLVHRKFAPALNTRWYLEDVAIIALAVALATYATSQLLPPSGSRSNQLASIVISGLMGLIAGAAASSAVRSRIQTLWNQP